MHKILDYKVSMSARPQKEIVDFSVKMLGIMYEWHETMGEGIKVGIIDTGIDLNHDDLKDSVKKYINFTTENRNDVTDTVGHGTHVAGCIGARRNNIGIIGAAPKCDLYIAKAFDNNGYATDGAVINSLKWMLENKVNVINMSFSADAYNNDEKIILDKCHNENIILVAAAGNRSFNDKNNTIGYPARLKSVIAVTAVDANKNFSSYSSGGEEAQVAAVGTDVFSTYKDNSYAVMSGTSMATPLITASVAIIQGKAKIRFGRYLTPYEVNLIIDMYADDLGKQGKDKQFGYGLFSFGRYFV